jgi:mannose-6-phosphate isomerase-like protein (cupin superfamily)
MAYAIKNIKEIDDSAVEYGLSPKMEARFGRKPLRAEKSGLSYQRFGPGFRQPFGHRHKDQEETYVVVGGSGRAKVEDDIVELHQWDALRVPPETPRAFEGGPDGIELVAFGAGEAGDTDMIEDFWPADQS